MQVLVQDGGAFHLYTMRSRVVLKIVRRSMARRYSKMELRESPYTIPNALTLARLAACPFLGYSIVKGDFAVATGVLVASGASDWVSGD